MDALAHHREGCLGVPILVYDVFERHTRLIIVVTLALDAEHRVCKSGVQVQMVGKFPIVLDIEAEFVRVKLLAGGGVGGVGGFGLVVVLVADGSGLRRKIVVQVVDTEFDRMFWRRHIVEV